MSPITTHILDTSKGCPAKGVSVSLEFNSNEDGQNNDWQKLGQGVTDDDGRIKNLLEDSYQLKKGHYRLTFAVEAYFSAENVESFYRVIPLEFHIETVESHYHVPLLLNPFGYSTYRGS